MQTRPLSTHTQKVCKAFTRGFDSRPRLHPFSSLAISNQRLAVAPPRDSAELRAESLAGWWVCVGPKPDRIAEAAYDRH